MTQEVANRKFPVGTGWVLGFAAGFVFGAIVWFVSAEVSLGLILFVATGTTLGFTFEQSLETRQRTVRERYIVFLLLVAGVVVGALVLIYATIFA